SIAMDLLVFNFILQSAKTIGILLCRDKNDAVVQMTLPEDNDQIFASKYEEVLPGKKELQKLLEEHLSEEDDTE
ncbi:MAG: DUF1016 domain-containing protein, partial [Clostridiales bacterium]|nr:DUF1016 domain-containing protein [Clostridiales bacterium]